MTRTLAWTLTQTTARQRLAIGILGVTCALAWPGRARANDPATAQMLFDQARKLMAREKYAEACPKLEESQRLDPAGGTLLHLAVCREREGRIATAWAHYQEALSQAKRDKRADRAKFAEERIDVLGPRLPKMRVRIAPGNRGLHGFHVVRDGVDVGEAQWGEPVPVDPGAHTMTAEAEGHKRWTAKIDVPARPSETAVDVPELEVDEAAASAAAPDENKERKKVVTYDDATRGDGQRTLGLVAGGVGIAGLVVGGVFGLISISKKNAADAECRPSDRTKCSQEGVDLANDGLAAGNVSTIAVIAGAALVAGGAVLYFTAPDASTTVGLAPSIGPRAASLSLTARFR